MSEADTLVSVIVGVCRQDPERWRQFDTIYRPMLLTYMRNRGLSEFHAQDLVQDVFVKLLSRLHTYDHARCRFRSWLFTVANRTLIDFIRREASRKRALDGWMLQVLQPSPSDSIKLEQEWTQIHRQKILAHALRVVRAGTSSKSWICFEQRLLRNRSGSEIARDLGISPNEVYVNACRVMKRVRSFCDGFDEDISHGFDSEVGR
jgi:RNA polymerase sigma factor (sigma-70 family)